ncbi:hypothetical protein CYR52_01745 [Chimaeribacter arupi]|nr:hypothetical protein CYR52_01745 [Chimaeribacter arupi]
MKRFTYRACVMALLPLLPAAAWAGRECNFKSSGTFVLLTGTITPLPITGTVTEPKLLRKNMLAYDGDGIVSGCSTGPDGQNLHARSNLQDVKGLPGVDGVQFKTNIPGIVYNVHMMPNTTSEVDGYLPPQSEWKTVVYMPGEMDSENGKLDGEKWRVYIDIYQDADYRGNNGISRVQPLYTTKLGDYRLGETNGQPVITLNIEKGSFAIPISAPTCTSAVADVSNSTVDFGDVNINDLGGGRVPVKPFSITLSGCSLVNSVTAKLTTLFASEDGNMMANAWMGQPGYAEGLGVQIRDVNNNMLRPNDLNSSSVINGLEMAGTVKLNYTAELRADGKARKAGPFQATGVFTLSYQ